MGGADTGWRLAAFALAWVAGVAVQLGERALMPPLAYALALALGLAGMAAAWRWQRALWLGLIGAVLLGLGSAGARATARLAEALPAALEGRDLVVTGVVASLPQRGPSGLRFLFEVESAHLDKDEVRVPPRVSLGWYRGFHEDAALSQPQSELRAGQRWQFTVRLRQPHGNVNPHGFDYELYLFERGVRATGYVRDAPARRIGLAAGYPVERLRQWVRDAIDKQVSDRRAAGVLTALAVGDQGAIEREDWDLFRNTGIAHLVAISGLHVTMFAWLAGLGIASGWRRVHRAALWIPAPIAARWGGFGAAAAYALLAGWGVPAQRTVWMLATVTVLQSLGVRWPWPLVLLAAAVVVTAVDPWALLQAGFWLSFVAVGLLIAAEPVQRSPAEPPLTAVSRWRDAAQRLANTARSGIKTQWRVTLGLAPLTLVFFQQVSVVGFAANLVAIPVVTLLITPLALLGAVAPPLWTLGAWGVQLLTGWLGWLAALPGAVWTAPAAPAWAQGAGVLGAVLLVLPLPWRARLLALPLMLPLLMPVRESPAAGQFEVVAVDVGQGTAVLVRTSRHLLVYDAGPQYSRDSDAGQRVLLPLLRARGEERIDRLVLSHRDTDHVGGARALLDALPVGLVLSSLEPWHPVLALAPGAGRCEAGQSWEWDGVRFEFLRPQGGDYLRGLKSNALSCVLRVSGLEASLLLTGDIEREQERALVAELGGALRSSVLLVAHHGSATSSTPAFLAAVQPSTAVIQAGYRNRFGHPAPEVLHRLSDHRIRTLTSPDCGAWRWLSSESPLGRCERDTGRRYWRHGQPGRPGGTPPDR